MIIKISNLANGRYDYAFEDEIAAIDISEPYEGTYKTKVILNRFEDQIILDAETSINANLVCDRCNTNYSKLIVSNYRIVYLLRENEYNNDSTDMYYVKPETDKINISSDVRDFALLAIPMKNLCKEECKGLCTKCGQNLNEGPCNCKDEGIDERWKPLLDFNKTEYNLRTKK